MKNKWMIVDGDIDFMLQKRVLDSSLTYRNWKRLDRFCRKHSKSFHIASNYDCTGQICGTYYSLKIEDKKFVLYLRTSYDC